MTDEQILALADAFEEICCGGGETMYPADSLSALAFDENGSVADQEQYQKRIQLPNAGLTEVFHLDFSSGEYSSYFRFIKNSFLGEEVKLEMPVWTLQDSTRAFNDYNCKKATASYLGRGWTVWYTEEMPVNAGPWLLWGCPGLIVYAIDREKIFNFYMTGLVYAGNFRWGILDGNYIRGTKVQHLTVNELRPQDLVTAP